MDYVRLPRTDEPAPLEEQPTEPIPPAPPSPKVVAFVRRLFGKQ